MSEEIDSTETPSVSTATLALNEAHRRLDDAGIPPAQYTVCDDPSCQSLVGHRIQTLRNQRDEARELLGEVLKVAKATQGYIGHNGQLQKRIFMAIEGITDANPSTY